MSVRIVRTIIAILALITIGAGLAQADPASVEVKFKFIVGGKILEPGNYSVDSVDGRVVITPAGGNPVKLIQVRTLGQRKVSKTELVFEEAGSMMYLSEIWIPGKDGVKVGGSDGAERRVTVGAKNGK